MIRPASIKQTFKKVETVYIKDVESDNQQAISLPLGESIKQMGIWNDSMYVITKRSHQLLYADQIGGLCNKATLKPHPQFKGAKIFKMAFGLYHMMVLADDGAVYAIGDNEVGQ